MKSHYILTTVFFFILVNSTLAEPESIAQSMNEQRLEESYPQSYRFIVAGHIYGNPDCYSIYPAETFITDIPRLKALDPSMIVLLGDTVRHSREENFNMLKDTVLEKFDVPIYNAVGNHDVENRTLYESRYNKTFYTFKHQNSQMIFIDTELSKQNITGEQYSMLINALSNSEKDHEIQNIFIFMHKPLFFIEDERYRRIAIHVNAWSSYSKESNFKEILSEQLLPLSRKKDIFLIAGDVGVQGSFPLFYDKEDDAAIHYLATGLGETEDDSVLLIDVNRKNVSITPISLTGRKLEDMEVYNTTYWEDYFDKKITKRENPLKSMLKSRRFYFGVFIGLLISLSFFVKNRWKKQE